MSLEGTWEDQLLARLRERNTIERDPFQTLIVEHRTLHNRLAYEASRADTLGAEVQSLKHDASRMGGTGGAGGEQIVALNKKIEKLQLEVTELLRRNSEQSESTRRHADDASNLRAKLDDLQARYGVMEAKLESEMKRASSFETTSKGQADEIITLKKEVINLHTLLETKESECARFKAESQQLTHRIVEEKMKAMEQVNEMNHMLSEMKRRLRSTSGSEGSGSRDGRKSTGGGGGSGGGGRSSLDEIPVMVEAGVPATKELSVRAHTTEVTAICFTETGTHVATASSDGSVRLWDVVSGRSKARLEGSGEPFMSVDLRGNLAVGGSNDRTVRLWDVNTERTRSKFIGHAGKVYSSCFLPDNRTVVSGGTDRLIKLWDIRNGKCIRSTSTPSILNDLAVSSDGGFIVSGHQDSGLRLWDLRKGAQITESKDAHSSAITSVRLSHGDGSAHVISCSRDNTVRVLDSRSLLETDEHKVLKHSEFRAGFSWASAASSPSLSHIAAPSSDGNVVIWKSSTGNVETTLPASKECLTVLDWTLDGRRLAVADKVGNLMIYQ